MNIIRHKGIFFLLSGVLVALSIVAIVFWGLNLSIDFTGGTLVEVSFSGTRPANDKIKSVLEEHNFHNVVIQPTGEKNILLRLETIDTEQHDKLLDALSSVNGDNNIIEQRFESIGPVIGNEIRKKSILSIITVLVAILLYVAWAFRKVSRPIASWRYGVIALVALSHDILIVVGVFSVLGRFFNIEVGIPFVAALLTILGYSVNDTIVVFDRTRENLLRLSEEFKDIVSISLSQTYARSINTSFTTLLVLFSVYFLGGESIRFFALALILGIIFGTYSSLFIASPLLVVWEEWRRKKYER